MARRIEEDHKEFRDLIKDKVKSKLKEYIKTGKRLVRRGKEWLQIDIPVVEIPNFRFGDPFQDGIGNGDADVGQEIGSGPPQPGDGGEEGRGGQGEGDHVIGVGVSLDYYIEMLGEELELPKLEPKKNAENVIEKVKYNRISKVGNNSLLHKKRTFKNALKRVISTDDYDPKDLSNVYPIREDREYKSWSIVENPDVNAVIFFMADISASMTPDKRELIQQLCWYLEMWISKFYKETRVKYIVHDWTAQEVDREKFYGYTSGGGTRISSAFELVSNTIKASYPLAEWNIYCVYLSDGESWDQQDNQMTADYIKELQKVCNMIGVTEVKGVRDWADFLPYIKKQIEDGYLDKDIVETAEVKDHDGVLAALRRFLSVGK